MSGHAQDQKVPYVMDVPLAGDIQTLEPLLIESLKGKEAWLSDTPYLNAGQSSALGSKIFGILRSSGLSPFNDSRFKLAQTELGLDTPRMAALTLNDPDFSSPLPAGLVGITHGGEEVKFEDLSYEEQLALMEIKLFELWALSLNTTAEALLIQYDPNLLRFFQISRADNKIILNLDRFISEMRAAAAVKASA